jgi:REP element-mobilizing transposase RayT
MASKNVPLIKDQYYHIYNRAIARNLLFRDEHNYPFFLSKVESYILPKAEVHAYCLMPNHYHFILKLTSDEISTAMQRLAISYAKSYNLVYRQKGHLFQGPFQRILITDLNYLLHLSRYIHLNPVKAQLVRKPEEWEYSSYHEYIGLRSAGYIETEPILNLTSADLGDALDHKQYEYKKFVEIWEFDYMEFKMQSVS